MAVGAAMRILVLLWCQELLWCQVPQGYNWIDVKEQKLSGEDLNKTLDEHAVWLSAGGNAGRKANLNAAKLLEAPLSGRDLSSAHLAGADLFKAQLNGAKLNQAKLNGTTLDEAILYRAELNRADLKNASLRGAELAASTLNNARLINTNLQDANFDQADLAGAVFEPRQLPTLRLIARAKNLECLTYINNPDALTRLRKEFQDGGFREQERRVTYALNRSHLAKLRENCGPGQLSACGEFAFAWIFFEQTSGFGLTPGRPLKLLAVLWLCAGVVYLILMSAPAERAGLYVVCRRCLNGQERRQGLRVRWVLHHPWRRMAARNVRVSLKRFRAAAVFSLMTAFNLGFRELNVGQWLRMLQPVDYELVPTGWMRTLAGIQSLSSVYLLAMWVLTYFGRPFE